MNKRQKKAELERQKTLTAKQRRQIKGQINDDMPPAREGEIEVEPYSDTASLKVKSTPPQSENSAVRTKQKFSPMFYIAVAIVIIIITITAIVIPVWIISDYRYEDSPIVKIELSNDMVLTYKVHESGAPFMSTHFLFLARIGYFEGNVIFDTQDEWVRFGGFYESEKENEFKHRAYDTEFIEKTKKYFSDDFAGKDQLKYKLNKDSGSSLKSDDEAALYGLFGNSYMYTGEFEILGGDIAVANSLKNQVNNNSYNFYGAQQHFASAYDDVTKSNIDTLKGMKRSGTYYNQTFSTIVEPTVITITRVSVYNYNVPYSGAFDTYMLEKDMAQGSGIGENKKITTYDSIPGKWPL